MIKRFLFNILFMLVSLVLFSQSSFEKTYGMPGYNYGKDIVKTHDSCYLILGNKSGFTGSSDIYLIKIDTNGNAIWDKAIGTSAIEWGEEIIKTSDNGFAIVGYSNNNTNQDYDILLIKLDSNGNVKWQNTYGGSDWDFAYSIIETSFGFVITGETYSYGNGNNDVIFIRTDQNGDNEIIKTFGGPMEDVGQSVVSSNDTSFFIVGYTKSFGQGKSDGFLYEVNAQGDSMNFVAYGDSLNDKLYDILIHDTLIVLCGSVEGDTTKLDSWKMITNLNGKINRNYITGGSEPDEYYSACFYRDQKIVFIGYSESYGYDLKDMLYEFTTGGGSYLTGGTRGRDKDDWGEAVITSYNDGFMFLGTTKSYGIGISNIYLAKADKHYNIATGTHEHIMSLKENPDFLDINKHCTVFPNPAKGFIILDIADHEIKNCSIDIYNPEGKKVESYKYSFGGCSLDISKLNIGIYFGNVVFEDGETRRFKFVKQ
jgi:hypothetical protein